MEAVQHLWGEGTVETTLYPPCDYLDLFQCTAVDEDHRMRFHCLACLNLISAGLCPEGIV